MGIENLLTKLELLSRFRGWGEDLLDARAQAVERTAQQLAPLETGALRLQSGVEVTAEGDTLDAAIYFNAPHAAATEFGTALGGTSGTTLTPPDSEPRSHPVGQPIEIVPIRATKLVFTGYLGGTVFADRVMHPGVPAQPYLYPAGEEGAKELKSDVQQAMQTILAAGGP